MVVAERRISYKASGADIKFVQDYLNKLERNKVKPRPISNEMQKLLDKDLPFYKIRFRNDREEFRGWAILSEIQVSVSSNPLQREYFAGKKMVEILHNSGLNFEILEEEKSRELKSLSHK
ncbi:MAG: hypothetical protein KGH65_00690 [Candidatus Micrarchaeota archaeon]|nr:hypothetical protein [Candidatus Micrarchaeota archaeon]